MKPGLPASALAATLLVAMPACVRAAAATPPAAVADQSRAASYPTQAITIVVPFAAAGPTEAIARRLADVLARTLHARVIVETVGGDGGTRGAERVARARADGYTLLLHHAGHAAAPFVHRRLAYDPSKDFAPIGGIGDVPMTLVGRVDLPVGFADLQTWMRERGPAVRLAHAGPGSASYLCATRLAAATATKPTAVTYKGTSRAIDALQKGNVDLLCDQTLNTVGPISAKRVRAYFIAGASRLPALPEIPTAGEAGAEALNMLVWYGLFAPAATPPSVLGKLTAALQAALAQPALRDALQPLGVRVAAPAAATPEVLRERVAADMQHWRAVSAGSGAAPR